MRRCVFAGSDQRARLSIAYALLKLHTPTLNPIPPLCVRMARACLLFHDFFFKFPQKIGFDISSTYFPRENNVWYFKQIF